MSKEQPVKKFKVGAVQVAVWENKVANRDGSEELLHSATIERRYKDAKGNWQSSGSLHAADLPKAILALSKAYEFVALEEVGQESGGEVL